MITLQEDLTDQNYCDFVELSEQTSDAFSVLIRYPKGIERQRANPTEWEQEYHEYFETMSVWQHKMEPFLLKSRHDSQWAAGISYDRNFYFTINYYRFCKQTLSYVLEPKSLFRWNGPTYPEDICFFREGECWMSCCSHERFAVITSANPLVETFVEQKVRCIKEDDADLAPYYEKY